MPSPVRSRRKRSRASRWAASIAVGALVATLVAAPGSDASTTTNETAPVFLRNIGAQGSALPSRGDLIRATDIAAAPDGGMFVTDAGTNRVVRYGPDGTAVTSWGGRPGSAPGELLAPSGLAVGADGDVYVADSGNHRVQRFTEDGGFVSTWGSLGVADGQFSKPMAIAVGPDGDVWVTDEACRIQRFSAAGAFEARWGSCVAGPNAITQPQGIAVADDGTLYLLSATQHAVFHVTPDGQTRLHHFGSYGTGDGQFTVPTDLDLGGDGSVYVTDFADRVQRFSASGEFLSTWGAPGAAPGQFLDPTGVAVGPNGEVFTVEGPATAAAAGETSSLVQHFSATGSFVNGWGSYGDGLAELWGPKDVAAAPDGGMVVVDTRNQRIVRSGPDLVFDTAWGHYGSDPGTFVDPEAAAVAPDGQIYVADTGNNRIQRFTAAGAFLSQWGSGGTGPGQFNGPAGIAVDATGDVWVGDRGNNRVQRFSAAGAFEASVGTTGSGAGQFSSPSAVAVGDHGVFVADTGNNRVQRFAVDGSYVGQWSTAADGPPVGVAVDRSGGVWVQAQKATGSGATVRYRADGLRLAGGLFAVRGRGLDVAPDGHVLIADEHHVNDYLIEVVPSPAARTVVSLTPASPDAEVGRRIDFLLRVWNSGDEPLTGLAASYTATPACDGPLPDLGPGQTLERTCSHVASAADVGTIANRVSVSAAQIAEPVQSVAGTADVTVTFPSPVELAALGGFGNGPGQLRSPLDLAVGADGDLFVINDGATHREIDAYHDGVAQGAFAVSGTDLATDPDGDLYVRSGGDIDRYTRTGTNLGSVSSLPLPEVAVGIGSRAADGHVLLTTRSESYLWCDAFYCETRHRGSFSVVDIDADARTYVTHPGGGLAVAGVGDLTYVLTNASVVVKQGSSTVRTFPIAGGATDLDVDASGNSYIAYPGTDRVRVYSPTGQLVAQWPSAADRIAVDPGGARLFVLDKAASVVRVYGFGISGSVADENTDAALPGVVALAVDDHGRIAGATVSGSSGEYRLRVGPGRYRVVFVDPSGGHLGEWAWGHPQSDPVAATPITVGPTGATVDIGLLPARGSVHGTVSADGGGVVPGAWVGAVNESTGAIRGTVAAADGTYRVDALDPGDHLLAFVDPSGQRRFEFFDDEPFAPTAESVAVTAGASSSADASLAAAAPAASGSTIAGTVTADAGGGPVAGAWVVAVRSDGVVAGGAVTDTSGHYTIDLGPGTYRLQVLDPTGRHVGQWVADRPLDDYDGADVFTVGPGAMATVDAGLTPARGSIVGHVSDPSGPSAGSMVLAIALSTGRLASVATVAGDGSYEMADLVPGHYLVAFVDPWGDHPFEYHDDVTDASSATPVVVTAGQAVTADADLD